MDFTTTLEQVGPAGLRGPTPLLRLQGDERLIALTRRGNQAAYEALVSRYQTRLLSFCRHMLSSREDAEDVLQEVFAAAFNAILADNRPINARPWLYRIARNRCLNHMRRQQAIGVDSMDIHLAEHGTTTADKAHKRAEFRQLVADVQELPETQRTALLLREIDALSYDQIAEAMETTIPSVKSLLVRARVSLAEAAEARLLTCEEARDELAEVAEGLKRSTPPVRRHVRQCTRCATFKRQLRSTDRALAAMFPLGPLLLFKKFLVAQGAAAGTAGGAVAGGAGSVAGGAAAGSALSAGLTAIGTKAAAGLTAAAIVAAGAVEVDHVRRADVRRAPAAAAVAPANAAPVVVSNAPQEPVSPVVRDEPVKAAPGPAPRAPAPADAVVPPAEPAAATPASPSTVPVPPASASSPTLPPMGAGPLLPTQEGSDTVRLPATAPTPQETGGVQAPDEPAPAPAPAPAPEPTPAPAPPSEPVADPVADAAATTSVPVSPVLESPVPVVADAPVATELQPAPAG